MRSVLVTGGAGFIGGQVARSLLEDGYQVDIVDNLSTGKPENIPLGAEFLELDLRFEKAVQSLPRKAYAAILHLAGQASGEKSFDDPLYDLDANARSTLLLARWSLQSGVKSFIYASSMGVYGQCEQQPVQETADPRPVSYYGASKLSAERILAVASSQGLRTVCFRMFNVYGPGQNLADMKQGMISIYLSQLMREKSLLVKGSLDRVRDFIYVDDVVSAWKLAVGKPVSGILNLGTGTGTTVRDLITKLFELCRLPDAFPVTQSSGTPGDQFAMVANIESIRKVLGWRPTVSLDQGLAKIVAWAGDLENHT